MPTLETLATASPSVAVPNPGRGIHWVLPVLEVEVEAASRRPDGRLRHLKFLRARLDQLE